MTPKPLRELWTAPLSALLNSIAVLTIAWPWVLGVAVFLSLLATPQGAAVIEDFSTPPLALVLAVAFSIAMPVLCMGAVTMVSAVRETGNPSDSRLFIHSVHTSGSQLAAAMLIAMSPGLVLTFAIGSYTAGLSVMSIGAGLCLLWYGPTPIRATARGMVANMRAARWRRWMFALLVFPALGVAPVLTGAGVVLLRPEYLEILGPALISLIGISALTGTVSVVFVFIPRLLGNHLFALPLFIAFLAWAWIDPSDSVSARLTAQASKQQQDCPKRIPSAISIIGGRLPESGIGEAVTPEPLVFVSAEGGGMRAAFWSGVGLSIMDEITDGSFGESVAAVSGVSGGSLGVATWLASRELRAKTYAERTGTIAQFLSFDFLSGILGGLYFLDAPRLLFGPLWFETRREEVFSAQIAHNWQQVAGTDFFSRPFHNLCANGFRRYPVIYLNATDVLSGSGVSIDNIGTRHRWNGKPYLNGRNMSRLRLQSSVAEAIVNSARFPFLSTPASVWANATSPDNPKTGDAESVSTVGVPSVRVGALVDGGFFDNSGLSPVHDLLRRISDKRQRELEHFARKVRHDGKGQEIKKLKRQRFLNSRVRVFHFANDPESACLPLQKDWQRNLSPRAASFLELEEPTLNCQSEVAQLEAAVGPRPFEWLRAPAETLLAIRRAHAQFFCRRVRDLPFKDSGIDFFRTVSLARELTGAYGKNRPSSRTLQCEFFSGGQPLFGRQEPETAQRTMMQSALRASEDRFLEPARASEFATLVQDWVALTRQLTQSLECTEGLQPRSPPLGWYLTGADRDLMNCLARRAAIASIAPSEPARP